MSRKIKTNRKRILFICVLFFMTYFATFLRVDSSVHYRYSKQSVRLEVGETTAKLSAYNPFLLQNTEMIAEKITSTVAGHFIRGRLGRLEFEQNFLIIYLIFGGAVLLSAIFWNIVWIHGDLRIITRGKQLIGILHRSDGKK